MKIAISATGGEPGSAVSDVFGRCPWFIYSDSDTSERTAEPNTAAPLDSGAGIKAASIVVNSGAEALISGNLGPKALEVLTAAGVSIYIVRESTVEDALKSFSNGELDPIDSPTAAAHSGMKSFPSTEKPDRGRELDELRETLVNLRQQLADVIDRITLLERK